ncbi:MAG: GDP-mannose 4,6 dehydratase, partial [Rickettsiales bacterium]
NMADDYVIAAGITRKLKEFIDLVFETVKIDWREYVTIDPTLYRPTDIESGRADPSKAERNLNWRRKHTLEQIAQKMVESYIMGL